MKLSEITCAVGGRLLRGSPNDPVTSISTDSRTVSGGELFLALKGQNFDGHEFVEEALARGAAGAMLSERLSEEHLQRARWLIQVDDTTQALVSLAKACRRKFDPVVLAVTGTNGKSTTREMIGQLLDRRAPTLTATQSFNNLFGVCFTILRLSRRHAFMVLEMGTSAPGEIERLAEIARPQVGVVTNVSLAHLEGLGSLEGVAKAKEELLQSLGSHGTAVINADSPICTDMARRFAGRVVTFGTSEDAEVRATGAKRSRQGWEFLVNGKYPASIRTEAQCNIQNALAAMAACSSLGLALGDLASELSLFRPLPMRMEPVSINGVEFINDAYNANPASMAAAVEVLGQRSAKGRKVLVLGDMRELGERSDELHREMGLRVLEHPPDLLVTVGRKARLIGDVARSGMPEDAVVSFENVQEASEDFAALLQRRDTVLLKASRAVRLEALLESYNEAAVESIVGSGQVLSQKGCYGARCGKCIREH